MVIVTSVHVTSICSPRSQLADPADTGEFLGRGGSHVRDHHAGDGMPLDFQEGFHEVEIVSWTRLGLDALQLPCSGQGRSAAHGQEQAGAAGYRGLEAHRGQDVAGRLAGDRLRLDADLVVTVRPVHQQREDQGTATVFPGDPHPGCLRPARDLDVDQVQCFEHMPVGCDQPKLQVRQRGTAAVQGKHREPAVPGGLTYARRPGDGGDRTGDLVEGRTEVEEVLDRLLLR
jgi:hypothetical protein